MTTTTACRRRGLQRSVAVPVAAVLALGLVACSDDDGGAPASTDTATEQSAEPAETSLDELFSQVQNNAPTSERVEALTDIAMHFYWYGGDVSQVEEEFFQGITLHGDYEVVEEVLGQAVTLDPYDLDLRYSLASSRILQSDVPGALEAFEEILQIDEDQFNAHLLAGVYSRVDGDDGAFDDHFEALEDIDAARAQAYAERVEAVDAVMDETLNTEVPGDLPEQDHAFVVLGYALSDEGEMEEPLLDRLEVALTAAEQYPQSQLIVSGGVPKNGVTEADVMYDWLVENGIEAERIHKEDLATDTVENGLFSLAIAEEEGVEDVTVISSATHMRRALVIFNEVNHAAADRQGEDVGRDSFSNVVAMDFESEEEASEVSESEELVIFRDLMRASGVWAFPGLQR